MNSLAHLAAAWRDVWLFAFVATAILFFVVATVRLAIACGRTPGVAPPVPTHAVDDAVDDDRVSQARDEDRAEDDHAVVDIPCADTHVDTNCPDGPQSVTSTPKPKDSEGAAEPFDDFSPYRHDPLPPPPDLPTGNSTSCPSGVPRVSQRRR
uniref:Uncharacterized protein n=1 Tax=Neobodo designis TaxID=312471 RepID=A0A7S1M637_NEODS|mmetsp:Transcript_34732/g.107260  ORF Transcript_34732/g.107260 Transcript_34732/m.107260 type:complete len:152 (+) Transcript_34732:28-483(+)|eukprot:CAMPEP_0174841688 /NCGR_PEP_ID=MMETSP1114-20130205/9471_1 /TAXON_ID=312471 /ORGANISM="Neobodo designis, Strain CCAP 1951/1" /LENGTH=151 /DNA_ID=CAMNT_0016075881 /DNA_START=25 /DNA_END=480 /DNA_ORIENTATION=+